MSDENDKEWLKGTPFSKWIKRLEKLEAFKDMLFSEPGDGTKYIPTRFEKWQTEQMNKDYLVFKEATSKRIEELEQNYKTHKECITAFQIQLGDISAVIRSFINLLGMSEIMKEGDHKFLISLLDGGEPSLGATSYLKKQKEEQEDKGEAEPVNNPTLFSYYEVKNAAHHFYEFGREGYEDFNIEWKKWEARNNEL